MTVFWECSMSSWWVLYRNSLVPRPLNEQPGCEANVEHELVKCCGQFHDNRHLCLCWRIQTPLAVMMAAYECYKQGTLYNLFVLLNNSYANWITLARLNTATLSNKGKSLITVLVFCSLHLRFSKKTCMDVILKRTHCSIY